MVPRILRPPRSAIVHRAVFPQCQGRSATADLQLVGTAAHGVDPAIEMATAPTIAWATALHEEWVPRHWLQESMAHAAALPREVLSWNNACGPAAVVRLSLERIGWSVISASQWSNANGEIIDLEARSKGSKDVGGTCCSRLDVATGGEAQEGVRGNNFHALDTPCLASSFLQNQA